jgi:GNAT superfamily N-acetyltransferase
MMVLAPTCTIRRATETDLDALVKMSLRFQAEVYVRHLFATVETFQRLARLLLTSSTTAVWIACDGDTPVGMFAAALYHQPMSGELIGSEVCWWMEPEARGGRTGLRLLRLAETWAKDQGAATFQMMAPTKAVGRFYERLDYEQIETLYQRRLT